MKYSINSETQAPAIVRFAETVDAQLVVFVYTERHPLNGEDWGRQGSSKPQYLMIVGRRQYLILGLEDLDTVAGQILALSKKEVHERFWQRRYKP